MKLKKFQIDIRLGLSSSGEDAGDEADVEEERQEEKMEESMAMLGGGRSRVGSLRQPGLRRISAGCMGGTVSPPPPAAPLRNMRVNR